MDTIIIILLSFIQPVGFIEKRYTDTFNRADSSFNKEYRLDIEALRRAAEEATKDAEKKTKHLRPKIPTVKDLINDSLLNEFNQNYKRFEELNYGRKTKRRVVGYADLFYYYPNVRMQKRKICARHVGKNRQHFYLRHFKSCKQNSIYRLVADYRLYYCRSGHGRKNHIQGKTSQRNPDEKQRDEKQRETENGQDGKDEQRS